MVGFLGLLAIFLSYQNLLRDLSHSAGFELREGTFKNVVRRPFGRDFNQQV
jgi:hypothetical protein